MVIANVRTNSPSRHDGDPLVVVGKSSVGTLVGSLVGSLVVSLVGSMVGQRVGLVVSLVGSLVGTQVVVLVGLLVGSLVGSMVGSLVGTQVVSLLSWQSMPTKRVEINSTNDITNFMSRTQGINMVTLMASG